MIPLFFKFMRKKEQPQAKESRLFREDREQILELLESMGHATLHILEEATRCLLDKNQDKAGRVIEEDDPVDRLEVEIEQACLSAIALRKPVRDDLRFFFSVLKIITDLERMADQAVNIAQRVIKMEGRPYLKPLEALPRMADISMSMLTDSLKSFRDSDPELAREVFRRDDEVDHLNLQVSDDLFRMMGNLEGDESVFTRATDLILVAHYYERVGDHACNIAERAFFMITGERIRQTFDDEEEI